MSLRQPEFVARSICDDDPVPARKVCVQVDAAGWEKLNGAGEQISSFVAHVVTAVHYMLQDWLRVDRARVGLIRSIECFEFPKIEVDREKRLSEIVSQFAFPLQAFGDAGGRSATEASGFHGLIIDQIEVSDESDWEQPKDCSCVCVRLLLGDPGFYKLEFTGDLALVQRGDLQYFSDGIVGFLELLLRDDTLSLAAAEAAAQKEVFSQVASVRYGRMDAPYGRSLVEAFYAVVEQSPNAVAVVSTRERWTYQKLFLEAQALAGSLVNLDLKHQSRVALLFHQEPQMIAAMLAVLMAGHTYVPLSVVDPAHRTQAIVANTSCSLVLVGGGVDLELRSLGVAVMLAASIEELGGECQHPVRSGSDLAYVLHTSGTTGAPKGVVQSDLNVMKHIASYSGSLSITSSDRITLFAALGSDAAVKNVFGAILNGACLCIWDVKRDGLTKAEEWLRCKGVTVWHSTPTLYRAALGVFARPIGLRWLVFGGEAPRDEDIQSVHLIGGAGCRVLVGYSQTESSTSMQCFPTPSDLRQVMRPCEDTVILLLDEHGSPAAHFGEIAVVSDRVALRYWNNDTLSSSRFLRDPLQGRLRMYLTGDLARRVSGAGIEVIGRRDDQVKIRGFRVEIKEVEAFILRIPGVKNTSVIPYDNSSGKTILAFIHIDKQNEELGYELIFEIIREGLPDYMVPSSIYIVDEFPLLKNGKIDRSFLIKNIHENKLEKTSDHNESDIEFVVRYIWEQVMNISIASIDDNFFKIGGHSLMAVRINSEISTFFDIEIPLPDQMRRSNIRSMSALVKEIGLKNNVDVESAAHVIRVSLSS